MPQRVGGTRSLSRESEEIHATATNESILLIITSRLGCQQSLQPKPTHGCINLLIAKSSIKVAQLFCRLVHLSKLAIPRQQSIWRIKFHQLPSIHDCNLVIPCHMLQSMHD